MSVAPTAQARAAPRRVRSCLPRNAPQFLSHSHLTTQALPPAALPPAFAAPPLWATPPAFAMPPMWAAPPALPFFRPPAMMGMAGGRPSAPALPLNPLMPLRPAFSFATLLTPPWVFVILATILAYNQSPLFG